MVFLPLRGWNLKEKLSDPHVNIMTAFILNGLGLR
jgi:hypothetical protein